MTQTIWKFPLDGIENKIKMPQYAALLHVGRDPATRGPAIWAQVDPVAAKHERTFVVVGTGHQVEKKDEFIGTAICDQFVWHIFERDAKWL